MNNRNKITLDNIPDYGSLHPATLKELFKEIKLMASVKLPEEPGANYGIVETRDVVNLGIALANSVVKTLEDDKITIGDIPNFIAPVMKLPAALSGITLVPAELDDLDEVELQELTQLVKDDLEVDSATAQAIIKESIYLLYCIYRLTKIIIKK